ncbi:MAG: glycosyltransferase [Clostridiaceae bacterium]|jgi:glycosyltransferase involved in cell wall biosynthesis|nr:glycosyltransferase [Clostridiaceae bacterium]
MTNIVLSICMMVKDEEKNLKRCLDSLKTLLGKGDVELIIVDTGSKDRTVSIAKQYTNKVYYHQWNNNFSDMRNITISYAKGKYIMIMDADEVLLDPLLLYEYINDPRLQSFNTYLIKIKNFDSSGGFTVLVQERIFKNDGEFCYEGAVHNQPAFKTPVLNADIFLEHYGYMFHDKELRDKKFHRTAGILRSELEKEPDNPYYRFQLARSYSAHGDNKEALEEIRKAYHLIIGNQQTRMMFSYVYGTYSIICVGNNEYKEAITVCKEGLEIRADYLDLYYVMAVSHVKLGRKADAQQAYERYIDLARRYDKLAISADRAVEMYYTGTTFQDAALGFVANELIIQQKYHEAYEYIKQINEERIKIEQQARVLLKLRKFDELLDLYKQQDNPKTVESVICFIEAEKDSMSSDERREIEEVFSKGEDLYSTLNKVRCADGSYEMKNLDKAIKETDFSELPDYYAGLLIDVDKNTRQAISVFKRISKTKIKQYMKIILECEKELESFWEEHLINEKIRDDDYQSLRVFTGIAYYLLYAKVPVWRDTKSEPSDLYYSIFKLYIGWGIKYTSILYSSQRLRLYYSMLEDQEDRFFIALKYAIEAADRQAYRSGIVYFKEAARANPFMAPYMKIYKDELFPNLAVTDGEDEKK